MPEQPEPSTTALGEIARDAADRATPADAATVDFAAVTSGPETQGKRRRGLRVGVFPRVVPPEEEAEVPAQRGVHERGLVFLLQSRVDPGL